MMITEYITLRRLRVTTGDKRAYYATATIGTHIDEEQQHEGTELPGDIYGIRYKCWMESPEVIPAPGDYVVRPTDGKTYEITEVHPKQYGLHQHYLVFLNRRKA